MRERRRFLPVPVALFAAVAVAAVVACEGLGGLTGGGPMTSDSGMEDGPTAPTQDNCPAGYRDCDRDPANGCETHVFDNASHCGFCGNVCPAAANGYPVCVEGVCRVACNKGFDNCDKQDANGCEENVSSNPLNCGACGHACVGPCNDALCTPTTITGGLDNPTTIAVGQRLTVGGSTYHQVYFQAGSPGAIYRINVNGGAPIAIPNASGTTTQRLLVDNARVYFVLGQDLAWCDEPCTASPPRPVYRRGLPQFVGDVSMQDPARGFSTSAFFIPGVGGGSSIQAFDKADLTTIDAAVPTTSVAFLGPQMPAITNDEANIYVATFDSIYVAAKDGGANQTLRAIADASVPQGGLAIDGDRLFFISGGQLYGCLASNCLATRKVYGSASRGHSVATDGRYVYWADPGTAAQAFQDGQILRCELGGCTGSPVLFAKGQHRPTGITLTATEIYWATQGNQSVTAGSIVRLAK